MSFAKIVKASDGADVLIFKDQDDEGRPSIFRMTEYNNVTVKLGVNYLDSDEGEAYRDEVFANFSQEDIDLFRQSIVNLLDK